MAYFPSQQLQQQQQQQQQLVQQQQQQQDVVSGDQYRYALTNFVCFPQLDSFVCGLTRLY
jgi:uncharacterized protein YhaN